MSHPEWSPLGTALGTIAAGVALFLARRRVARWRADGSRTFDRAYDKDGLAWWYGAMGILLAGFGVAFLILSLR